MTMNSSSQSSNNEETESEHQLFPPATQPDIVRASQKDEFYLKFLNDQIFDLVNKALGARTALRFQRELGLLGTLSFFVLTTVLGKQTLGEEYCDIVQITSNSNTIPNVKNRALLTAIHVVFPYVFEKILRSPRQFGNLIAPFISKYSTQLHEIIQVLQRLHLAVFYYTGNYYDVSKRILGIKYIFNRKSLQGRPSYQILGVLILFQLSIYCAMIAKKFLLSKDHQINLAAESINIDSPHISPFKCTLCLENRKYSTATSCGHLFCWDCITKWIASKPQCPLCRTPITPQGLTCVYHY